MATLYKVDGTITEVRPAKKKFKLEELQGFVGGYIQHMALKDSKHLIMNEEGRLHGLSVNVNVSKLFEETYGSGAAPILGDAIVLADSEWD